MMSDKSQQPGSIFRIFSIHLEWYFIIYSGRNPILSTLAVAIDPFLTVPSCLRYCFAIFFGNFYQLLVIFIVLLSLDSCQSWDIISTSFISHTKCIKWIILVILFLLYHVIGDFPSKCCSNCNFVSLPTLCFHEYRGVQIFSQYCQIDPWMEESSLCCSNIRGRENSLISGLNIITF